MHRASQLMGVETHTIRCALQEALSIGYAFSDKVVLDWFFPHASDFQEGCSLMLRWLPVADQRGDQCGENGRGDYDPLSAPDHSGVAIEAQLFLSHLL